MSKLKDKRDGLINGMEYKSTKYKVLYGVIIFLLIFFSVIALIPILWLFLVGFKDASKVFESPFKFFPDSFNIMKLFEVWKTVGFTKYFINTLVIMIGAVVCAVVFNGLLAYAISILKPAGSKIVYSLVLASYMIPAVASLVPLYGNIISLKLSGYGIYIPLCLLYGANAYYFMMFKNYFDTIPRSLFEAAKIDGASSLDMFFRVAIPLSKPIISVVAIFSMTATWADFLLPYLLIQKDDLYTVMVKIYNLKSTMPQMANFGMDKYLMSLSITVIPQIILFLIFQKQITGINASSGIKE